MGVVTPVGNDVDTYWKNLLDGVCGIDYIKAFPADDLPVKIAVAAAYQAMQQSGLSASEEDGHMLGAAGAAEAVASILALKNGVVPPTINLDEIEPECDLNYTPNKPVEAGLTIAVSDSLGFGGHNGCVAFRKYVD